MHSTEKNTEGKNKAANSLIRNLRAGKTETLITANVLFHLLYLYRTGRLLLLTAKKFRSTHLLMI